MPGGLETSMIPTLRQVYSEVYANLPNGQAIGDLGYATDRKVLYRWDGSAWVAITISSLNGTYAAMPAAAGYPESSLYQTNDTNELYMIIAGAWELVGMMAKSFTELAGGGNHAPTGNDTWEDWDISAIVPAGVRTVLVGIIQGTAQYDVGVREKGSGLARKWKMTGTDTFSCVVSRCDANRVLEIYGNTGASDFNILGYWS